MRKLIFRLLFASVTFGIGLSAVLVVIWLWSIQVGPVLVDRDIAQVAPPSAAETEAQDVSVCNLKNDPAKYNRSLVKLTGFFSRGFEDSTLYDPTCKTSQWIWVELGGKRSIGVMYCCGFTPKRVREDELEVEGVKLPLTEDANFNQYDQWLAKGKSVKATVIGTFFSGKKVEYPNGTYYGGYGHMGIGSLFIVQQVLSSEVTKTENRLP